MNPLLPLDLPPGCGEYLRRARTLRFCSECTRTGLIFTPSQNMASKQRKPIGRGNCINTILPTNIAQSGA